MIIRIKIFIKMMTGPVVTLAWKLMIKPISSDTSLKATEHTMVFLNESPKRIALATGIIISDAINSTPTISMNRDITIARITVIAS